MKTRIKYRRARVTIEYDRIKVCQACGVQGRTELHHYLYKYSMKMVRENPQLALENTVEFCYKCHRLADALRKLFKDPTQSQRVLEVIISKIREDAHGK